MTGATVAEKVRRRHYRPKLLRKNITWQQAETRLWPIVSIETWEDEPRLRFETLKDAVDAYVGPGAVHQRLASLGVTYGEVQRAVERCLTRHEDGRLFGYRALIPSLNVRGYTRAKALGRRPQGARGGFSGALQLVFKEHSTIKLRFDHYLKSGERHGVSIAESHVTDKSAHSYFLALCSEFDQDRVRYPFTTKQLGKSAVRDYKRGFFDANYDDIVTRQSGEKAAAKAKTGTGFHSRLIARCPYEVVEIDEHRADFLGMLWITTPSGRRQLVLRRVVLITCTDRRSGVVLGYNVVFKREANKDDFLAAVQHALDPWKPREFYTSGQYYDEGAGFPSSRICDLEDCGWGSVLLDGALIHIADPVLDRMRDRLGCDINIGPVRRFERRAVGELTFKALEALGFHRLLSTTGSGPEDPRRQNPEANARTINLTMDAVLDVVELCIAHYNHVVTSHVDGISGLDFIEQWATDPEFDTLVPRLPKRPPHHARLDVSVERLNVTGDRGGGVRPRVYFAYTHYTSTALARRMDLIGTEVIAHVDPNDIRRIELFEPTGAYLGAVESQDPQWRVVPHSLAQRIHVSDLVREGKLEAAKVSDWLTRFLQGLSADVQRDAARRVKGVSDAGSRLAEELRKLGMTLSKLQPAAAANEDEAGEPSHPFLDPVATATLNKPASRTCFAEALGEYPPGLQVNLNIKAIN